MPMKSKKIPMRMCIGCHEMKPKKELLRIVQPKEGELSPDPTGKAQGRGSYICANTECLDRAMKSKNAKLPQEVADQLRMEIQKRDE